MLISCKNSCSWMLELQPKQQWTFKNFQLWWLARDKKYYPDNQCPKEVFDDKSTETILPMNQINLKYFAKCSELLWNFFQSRYFLVGCTPSEVGLLARLSQIRKPAWKTKIFSKFLFKNCTYTPPLALFYRLGIYHYCPWLAKLGFIHMWQIWEISSDTCFA